MSYQSQVLGLSGLVGYWPLNDAAGSLTGADLGPNNLTLTYSVAKPSGPQLLQDYPTSLGGDGSTVFAFRTVAANTPLQITGNCSFGFWFKANATSLTNDYNLICRNANWPFLWKKQQFIQFVPRLTGGAGSSVFANGSYPPAANQIYFIGGSWDGQEITLWSNGEFDAKTPYVGGSIARTTDRFDILSNQGNLSTLGNGSIGGVFVCSRALNAGEWKSLFLAGTMNNSFPTEGNFYDFTFDQFNAAVASASTLATRCPVCAGQLRTNEPQITAGSLAYHTGCYGAHLVPTPLSFVTASSTVAQVVQDAARLIHDQTLIYATHSANEKLRYHDGSVFHYDISQGGVTSSFQRSTSGVAAGMAVLYKYAGVPKDHWTVAIAKKVMANNISMQNADGSFGTDGGPNAQFILQDMGECILQLRDTVPQATIDAWTGSFIAGCNYLQSTSTFYVNGNIEIAVTYIFWLAYLVTKDAAWQTRYTTHLNFTISPPQTGQTAGFGIYLRQSDGSYALYPSNLPTNADWSDGQGYLAESTNQTPSSPKGLDYDYLQLQMDVVTKLWHWSKDPWALKIMNIFINLALNVQKNGVNRLNTTTWSWDATGGTRHNLVTSFESPIMATLIWNGLRPDLTSTYPASMWAVKVRPDFNAAWGLNNQNYWRGIGDTLGQWVMASPSWVPNTIPGQI
jgi:hypothetical protein